MPFSEMMAYASLLRGFFAPYANLPPGVVGLEACESLSVHLTNKRMIAAEDLARDFTSIQQAPEQGELGDAVWHPAP